VNDYVFPKDRIIDAMIVAGELGKANPTATFIICPDAASEQASNGASVNGASGEASGGERIRIVDVAEASDEQVAGAYMQINPRLVDLDAGGTEHFEYVKSVCNRIQVADKEIVPTRINGLTFIHLEYDEPCILTGEMKHWPTRDYYVQKGATESDIVRAVHLAASRSAQHQVDEGLTFDTQRVFNPHRDVDDLHALAVKEHQRDLSAEEAAKGMG
jgi:hypothetical protein